MLEIKAEKQNLYRTDADGVIADSRNYLTAKFELSEEWTGEVTAIFGYGGKFYHQVLTENSCTVPWEVIHAPYFTVSLFCGDLITSDELHIRVGKSGFEDGEVPGTPTPTVWQGYIDELAEKNREIAEELDKNVDKKIDGKADKNALSELEEKTNTLGEKLGEKVSKDELDICVSGGISTAIDESQKYTNSKFDKAQKHTDDEIANVKSLVEDAKNSAYDYAYFVAQSKADKTELPTKVSDLENDEGYVKNTDVASYTKLGLVQGSGSFGFGVNQRGVGFVQKADNTMITARTDSYHPIVPSNLDYAVRSVLPQTADAVPSVLAANTEYYLGETAELTFAFPTAGELGQYCFVKFDSGETAANLTVSGNNFAGDIPAPKANTTYEIIATWNGTKWVSSYRGY